MELLHLTLFVKHYSHLYRHLGSRLLFTFISLLVFTFSIHAQEICDNGIDDDGDGLIDLNDTIDCSCIGFGGVQNLTSLIPNSSFEDHSCCPHLHTQLHCADTWIQASDGTSDYFNTCGITQFNSGFLNIGPPAQPLPDGDGYIGFFDHTQGKEYVGACLPQPMLAGVEYELNFYLGYSQLSPPFPLVFYGNPNCNDLPFNTNCPLTSSNSWMILGTINIPSGTGWVNFTTTFTPPVDIYGFVLGPDCSNHPPGDFGYYYMDALSLNVHHEYSFVLNLNKTGTWCNNNIVLHSSNDTTPGLGSYQWYKDSIALVGEISDNLDVSANGYGAGDYNVRLSINGQCEVKTITIDSLSLPTANATFNNACAGNAINFIDQSSTSINSGSITNWNWDFGDSNSSTQQNPTHAYNQSGTYNLSLTIETDSGCADVYQTTVDIYPSPNADFSAQNVCVNDFMQLTDLSTVPQNSQISSWNWNFNSTQTSVDTNPSFFCGFSGNSSVELIVETTDGCADTNTQNILINERPIADFTFDTTCIGLPTLFYDNSTSLSGSISTYLWSFNPGNSNLVNPQHTYNTSGNYTAELIVISDAGCRNSISHLVPVNPKPVANFNYIQACFGDSTAFQNASATSGGSTLQFNWDFGDNYQSTLENPSHLYNTAGTHYVMLKVTSNEGCASDTTIQVSVFDTPIANFQVDNICLGDSIEIDELSTIGIGSIDSWHWDFGNGTTLNIQNPLPLSYSSANTYDVELIVASGNCTDTLTKQVEIYPTPQVEFSYENICLGEISHFIDQTNPNNSNLTNWNWNFGNGNVSSQQNPNYQYPHHGNYTVTLEAITSEGCTEKIDHNISIHPLPIVNFDFTEVCLNDTTQFDANVAVDGGTLSTIWWDFDNGSFSGLDKPSIVYTRDGTYNVTLTATTDSGCVNSLMQEVIVFPLPKANFSANVIAGCQPLEVVFNDLSSASNGNVIQWLWDFGDDHTSSLQYPSHIYQDSGIYTVTLTVHSDKGCAGDTSSINAIIVYPLPSGSITTNTTEVDIFYPIINFQGEASGEINTWAWELGDGTSSFEQNFEHEYLDTGYYFVELLVVNINGCIDTVTDTIRINDAFSFYIPNTFTPNSDGINDAFQGKGSGIAKYTLRIFNLWGEQIFFSTDPKAAWEGTTNNEGKVAPNGTYYYLIEIEDIFGKYHEYKGFITLVR